MTCNTAFVLALKEAVAASFCPLLARSEAVSFSVHITSAVRAVASLDYVQITHLGVHLILELPHDDLLFLKEAV